MTREHGARGFSRLQDPLVWGTTVGAAGGTAFVLANRGALRDPWPTLAFFVWAGALAIYVWFVFVARRTFDNTGSPAPHAAARYLGSVVGMLILIRIGTAVLDHVGATELRPALIVVAVGLHFFPFASAFHTPLFNVLGTVMVCIGAGGARARRDHGRERGELSRSG
ncbi:hypothetical protein F0U44_15375 [Nocardioides humilatus]|uniref:Uncharacterized protein n=1 Tax=Nocardioides humilatus TaxID=2607660 RepID=A0A5B1LB64_9ACTN|nr:hypothetical protein [Nocardioides humilatus]KAA1417676.1 hypothetical protein F0U44_15375 [Nocardioides humilatus]